MAQQFAFWRGSVAVPAASSDGVSPFEATWGGTPLELAGEDARATSKLELLHMVANQRREIGPGFVRPETRGADMAALPQPESIRFLRAKVVSRFTRVIRDRIFSA